MGRTAWKIGLFVGCIGVVSWVGCGPDDTAERDGQGSLQGQVTLEGADDYSGVEVVAGDESTTTDSDGEYQLDWLPAGELDVTADQEGYAAETKTVEIEAGEMTTADFELQLEAQPPAIEAVDIDPPELLPDDTAGVLVQLDNPDGVEVQFDYEATGGFDVEQTDEEGRADLITPDEWGATGELTVGIYVDEQLMDEEVVELEIRDHDDPVIESISAVPEQLEPGETGQLEVEASSPQGDELSYQWEATEDWLLEPDDEPVVEVTAPQQPEVTGTIEVVVTDEFGGEATDELQLSTRDNNPPEILEVTVDPPQVEPGGEIELGVHAEDPDGDELSYSWSAPSDWTLTDENEPNTTLVAPDEHENTAEVQIEVTDEHGAVATADIVVSTIAAQGPQIEAVSADPVQVERGGTIQLEAVASHPQGAELDYSWDAPANWTLYVDNAEPAKPMLIAPNVPGESATVEVTVTDPQGNEAVGSVLVSTEANSPPVIDSLSADPSSVLPEETTTISADAEDPDGEQLSYDWEIPGGWEGSSDSEQLELTAPDAYDESGTVQLTVDDGWDTTSATVSVSTHPSVDPNIESFQANPAIIEREGTSQLVVDADHAYGEPLSYEWSKDNDDWTLDAAGDTADLTAPDQPDDQVEVTVVVSDDYNGTAQSSVTVQTSQNNPPNISSFTADPYVVERQETSQLDVDAQDPDGGPLSYDWDLNNDDWTLDVTEDTADLTAPDVYDDSVTVTVTAEDDQGATNSSSVVVQTEQNDDPIIASFEADPQLVDREGSSQLSVDAFDPNGEDLDYDWSIEGDNEDEWTFSDDESTAELTAPNIPEDELTVEVVVDDGYGGTASDQLVVETEQNNPPVIDEMDVEQNPMSAGQQVDVEVDAWSPDGDDLSYDWNINDDDWTISGSGEQVQLQAPDDSSDAILSVTVVDEFGAEATTTESVESVDLIGEGTPEDPFEPYPLENNCISYLDEYDDFAEDGIYVIEVGGDEHEVYCDMTADGGGWTLVLQQYSDTDGDQACTAGWLLGSNHLGPDGDLDDEETTFKFDDDTINAIRGDDGIYRGSSESDDVYFFEAHEYIHHKAYPHDSIMDEHEDTLRDEDENEPWTGYENPELSQFSSCPNDHSSLMGIACGHNEDWAFSTNHDHCSGSYHDPNEAPQNAESGMGGTSSPQGTGQLWVR